MKLTVSTKLVNHEVCLFSSVFGQQYHEQEIILET